MSNKKAMPQRYPIDDRRDLIIAGNAEETVTFCVEQFIAIAKESIADHGIFSVALSGGSTPKAIFKMLASPAFRDLVNWSYVHLFWSDERCVPPTDPESNYLMAMEAGFNSLPIPKENTHRMPTDENPEMGALTYEALILKHVPKGQFDFVMLGMGEDGHTASLFPKTEGLNVSSKLVIANYIPQKHCWRMTLTFDCINAARHIAIYVIGESKATTLKHVLTALYNPTELPIQKVGTASRKALWIADEKAAKYLAFSPST